MTTSGSTSGAPISAPKIARPRNRPNRASAQPAALPSSTARLAAPAAMRSDSPAASTTRSLPISAANQRSEKPPH